MGEPIINGHFGKGKIDMVHNSTRITWKHLGAQQAMLHSWTMVVYIRVIRCLSPYFFSSPIFFMEKPNVFVNVSGFLRFNIQSQSLTLIITPYYYHAHIQTKPNTLCGVFSSTIDENAPLCLVQCSLGPKSH